MHWEFSELPPEWSSGLPSNPDPSEAARIREFFTGLPEADQDRFRNAPDFLRTLGTGVLGTRLAIVVTSIHGDGSDVDELGLLIQAARTFLAPHRAWPVSGPHKDQRLPHVPLIVVYADPDDETNRYCHAAANYEQALDCKLPPRADEIQANGNSPTTAVVVHRYRTESSEDRRVVAKVAALAIVKAEEQRRCASASRGKKCAVQ